MHILFVSDVSIKNVIGGAERVLYEQSQHLAGEGHQVTILTRRLSSHSGAYEKINGVDEYRYEIHESNPLNFIFSTIKNAQALYKILSQVKPFDVINFHQPFSALAVNLLPGTKKIKKIYTCHSLSFEEYVSRNPKTPSAFQVLFRKWIEKFSLDQSNTIVVLSEFTKNKITKTYKIPAAKIIIIPGGVDIDRFKPAADKKALQNELGLPEYTWILFTVRNLVPRMGLENLIKAMALIKEKNISMCLLIGGQGVLKENLQALIKEYHLENSVKLLGFLSKEDLLKYYQAAHFFILPTVELEGFGLVTVEAMASGTPVLGTPIGGTVEILNRFDSSFLFKNTSPVQMADRILEKYAHYNDKPDEYSSLTGRIRKFAEDNYSWNKNITELKKVF